ncbi:MAG: nitroreductase/quinone reductase family protein [Chloroflexota bacterium]
MSYSSEDLGALADAEEVEIETQAPEGPSHRTVIWIVVDDGEAFVRTYKGPGSRWYREAIANPAVALHVRGRRLASTAIPATDPDSIDRVSAAYRRKYAADRATDAMVAASNLPTTLRLEPA